MEAALPTYRGGVSTREQVKAALAAFAAAAPGRSVEIRVPPYGAVQAVPGGAHRRGTPCAGRVRRRDLAGTGAGDLGWDEAVAAGRVQASGERSDLSAWLPLAQFD